MIASGRAKAPAQKFNLCRVFPPARYGRTDAAGDRALVGKIRPNRLSLQLSYGVLEATSTKTNRGTKLYWSQQVFHNHNKLHVHPRVPRGAWSVTQLWVDASYDKRELHGFSLANVRCRVLPLNSPCCRTDLLNSSILRAAK